MFQGMEYIYEVYKEKAFPKLLLLFHFAAFFKRQCKTCGKPYWLSYF